MVEIEQPGDYGWWQASDGLWYPPESRPSSVKRRPWVGVLMGLMAFLVFLAFVAIAVDASPEDSYDESSAPGFGLDELIAVSLPLVWLGGLILCAFWGSLRRTAVGLYLIGAAAMIGAAAVRIIQETEGKYIDEGGGGGVFAIPMFGVGVMILMIGLALVVSGFLKGRSESDADRAVIGH